MHRTLSVSVALVVAAVLVMSMAGHLTASAPPREGSSAAARLDAARGMYEWVDEHGIMDELRDHERVEMLGTWSLRWAEAERDANPAGGRTAWEHHQERMRRLQKGWESRREAGSAGPLEVRTAAYFAADADVRLEAAR